MFIPSTPKRAHKLNEGDVLLWEGHYYIVMIAAPRGPALTEVVLTPVSPALFEFKTTLRSDSLIMLYAWH